MATFKDIVDEFLVETWNDKTNFEGYYDKCSPLQCTYRTVHKNDFFYLITRVIGLFGGLSVALRIIAPLIVKLGRDAFVIVCHRKESTADNQQTQTGTSENIAIL
ncbi:unnamed protein product [Rotaria sp. Silwood2]|nr:unnamed protein product [Rotaria sp. Silwood2]CAF3452741.1 unnamed protein product [Rotaria sp. Silwood2]CAF4305003.1 unnamed protein product [Rotaria sp. Silwood2]CAF4372529.1 unnamed protein product [Rotaria sp. Silwood2]CAF4480401.1 unnamed protein product [Rotaria sp. Silwood2]